MENRLQKLLDQHQVLLADGAIGTNLFSVGLQTGDAPELWNLTHTDRISALHRSFVDAGSDIILTNSFGGTHYRLALHDAQDQVEELNHRAAMLARREADRAERIVLVAGSIGPTGEILEPNGPVSIESATEAFAVQARALADGGADIIWIETMSSAEEILAAVNAAHTLDIPVAYTASIDTNGRTMMGLTAADVLAVSQKVDGPVTAVGSNCGVGAAELVAAIRNLATASEAMDNPPALIAKANCGIPEYVDGKIVYSGTPELMAAYTRLAAEAGARIIGGCCGTTAQHISEMRKAIDHWTPSGEPPEPELIVETLGEVSTGAMAQLRGDLSVAGGSASGRGSRRSRRNRRRTDD